MKRFASLVLFLMLGGYLLFALSSCTHKPTPKKTAVTQNTAESSKHIQTNTPSPKKNALSTPIPSNTKTSLKTPSKHYKDAFELLSIQETTSKVLPKKKVSPLNAFSYKKNTIKSLQIGDSILLPEINGFEYTLTIQKRTSNFNQSITQTANIEGEDAHYYAILTEGDKSAFVTINSSQGVYEMEIFGSQGYTYASKDIQNALIDYSKTDSLKPPKSF